VIWQDVQYAQVLVKAVLQCEDSKLHNMLYSAVNTLRKESARYYCCVHYQCTTAASTLLSSAPWRLPDTAVRTVYTSIYAMLLAKVALQVMLLLISSSSRTSSSFGDKQQYHYLHQY
jgi:hypothetical protein